MDNEGRISRPVTKTLPIAAALLIGLALGAFGALAYGDKRAELEELRAAIREAWTALEPELEARASLAERWARSLPYDSPELRDAIRAVQEAGGRQRHIDAGEALAALLAEQSRRIGEADDPLPPEELVRLRNRIADIENEIAPERRRYNEAVQEYNTALQLFPANLVAWLGSFERESAYFRTTEETRQAEPPVRSVSEPSPSGEGAGDESLEEGEDGVQ